ncbi:MAG: hypothetical protein IJ593_05000 [Lachnospiraceae bacterium]|nr:hypothetical protein [Lachnospiraceae bacterium]
MGKAFIYTGILYDSLAHYCRVNNLNYTELSTYKSRTKLSNSVELLNKYYSLSHIELNMPINYNGVKWKSVDELCKNYNINFNALRKYLLRNTEHSLNDAITSYIQTIRGYDTKTPVKHFIYEGKEWKSIKGYCEYRNWDDADFAVFRRRVKLNGLDNNLINCIKLYEQYLEKRGIVSSSNEKHRYKSLAQLRDEAFIYNDLVSIRHLISEISKNQMNMGKVPKPYRKFIRAYFEFDDIITKDGYTALTEGLAIALIIESLVHYDIQDSLPDSNVVSRDTYTAPARYKYTKIMHIDKSINTSLKYRLYFNDRELKGFYDEEDMYSYGIGLIAYKFGIDKVIKVFGDKTISGAKLVDYVHKNLYGVKAVYWFENYCLQFTGKCENVCKSLNQIWNKLSKTKESPFKAIKNMDLIQI